MSGGAALVVRGSVRRKKLEVAKTARKRVRASSEIASSVRGKINLRHGSITTSIGSQSTCLRETSEVQQLATPSGLGCDFLPAYQHVQIPPEPGRQFPTSQKPLYAPPLFRMFSY